MTSPGGYDYVYTFDALNRLETVTDPEGGLTRRTPTTRSATWSRPSSPTGRTETREYDESEPAVVPGEQRPWRRDLQLPLHARRDRAIARASSSTTAARSITPTTSSTAWSASPSPTPAAGNRSDHLHVRPGRQSPDPRRFRRGRDRPTPTTTTIGC